MFCENCGTKLLTGAKFCTVCGTKTDELPAQGKVAEEAVARPAPVPPPYALPAHTLPPQQQVYAQPQPPTYVPQEGSEPLRVGQYIGMFLLLAVPILNIVLLFMWSFGGSVNLNKKNFARASLILSAIMLIIWIVIGGVVMGALDSMLRGF